MVTSRPKVTYSVNACDAVIYNSGFKKPSGGSPFFMRMSLITDTMAAKTGAEALDNHQISHSRGI